MKKIKDILKLLIISCGLLLGLQTHAYDLIEVQQESIEQIYDYDATQPFTSSKQTSLDHNDDFTNTNLNFLETPLSDSFHTWQTQALPHLYDDGAILVFWQSVVAPKSGLKKTGDVDPWSDRLADRIKFDEMLSVEVLMLKSLLIHIKIAYV